VGNCTSINRAAVELEGHIGLHKPWEGVKRASDNTALLASALAVCLFLILVVEMVLSIQAQSQTFDEANHILAGYRYWRCSDFGTNPEHPPLLKLLATIPLLFSRLQLPVAPCSSGQLSTNENFVDGRKFLYANDANKILFETRLFAGTLTLFLGLLSFEAAKKMFGTGSALLALALFVFEPNLLAHGTLVTDDMAMTCCLFATVYAFYRYVNERQAFQLIEAGFTAGLTLVAKHSGFLVFPVLGLLALAELGIRHIGTPKANGSAQKLKRDAREALRLAAALVVIAGIAAVVLWAFYGFRFAARPSGTILPAVTGKAGVRTGVLAAFLRWHLLPESYYYGLGWQLMLASMPKSTFLLGTLRSQGHWFYFPLVLLIKSTLGFLLLLLVAVGAGYLLRTDRLRETLYLCIPALLYLGIGITSGTNVAIRYVLPLYPFLIVLVAAGTWPLARQHRVWRYIIIAFVGIHAISSLRSLPNYLPYSNEAWGGPTRTYRLLTDSNVDWGQGLKATKAYLDVAGISQCWFAYPGTADPHYYGIPCRLLDAWPAPEIVPQTVRGSVLISASELSGFFSGPPEFNPYAQFASIQPKANIAGSVLVFEGSFDLTLASAISHINRAQQLADSNRTEEALVEAQTAVALAPNNPSIRFTLGQILAQAQHAEEARSAYQTALSLAQAVHPELQKSLISSLRKQLQN
jgi:hypothetical protein